MKNKRTRYVHLYDTAQIQAWLEDQAAQGWFLEDAGGMDNWASSLCFGSFAAGPARAVRFRMVPMRTEGGGAFTANIPEPGRDMLELYEGMGWRYVCGIRDYYVFRADDPSAPEPFTDGESRAYTLRKASDLQRNHMLLAIVGALLNVGSYWPVTVMCALMALLSLRRYVAALRRLKQEEAEELEDREAYRDAWYLRWGDLLLNLMPWLVLLSAFAIAWARVIGSQHLYRP